MRRFGEKRFTAAGRGDNSLRWELLLVVARCRTLDRTVVGGVSISNRSSSDLLSSVRVGVLGDVEMLPSMSGIGDISQHCGVSGVAVISDTSRLCSTRFGKVMLSWGYGYVLVGDDGPEDGGDGGARGECHDCTV